MLARLIALLSVLSALLLMVTGVMWIRSYSAADRFVWEMGGRESQLKLSQGCFRYARVTAGDGASADIHGSHVTDDPTDLTANAPNPVVSLPTAGIVYGEGTASRLPYTYLILPYWLLFLIFAILPTWWIIALRKEIMGMFGK